MPLLFQSVREELSECIKFTGTSMHVSHSVSWLFQVFSHIHSYIFTH